MISSMSRSRYWLTALAPAADRVPPINVAAITHRDGIPRSARIIDGTVVMSRSSTIRGLVSLT
jgi:hypothetical protein